MAEPPREPFVSLVQDEAHGSDTTVAWVGRHRTGVVVVAGDWVWSVQSEQSMDGADDEHVDAAAMDGTWCALRWTHTRDQFHPLTTIVPIEASGWQSPDDLRREHDLPFVCELGWRRQQSVSSNVANVPMGV